MSTLMVAPYPPTRDGIAAYTLQEVAALRAGGEQVDVLSPYPSAAQQHLDLVGPRGALALARRVRRYDRVVVQFHPDYFFPLPKTERGWAVQCAALQLAFRAARRVEVRLHEVDFTDGRRPGALGVASRALWRSVDEIAVHTERERGDLIGAFRVPPDRVRVAAHGTHFRRQTTFDQAGARASLGIPADATVFLAIGFVQPHKGFDRAVRAFTGLADRGARLFIVGSARLEDRAVQGYIAELQNLVETTPGAQMRLEFVSDEMFDRWLVAADVIVLPYRSIWSSGVLERAALYDRAVIATAVGGLADQVADRPGVRLVSDDLELRQALWEAAGGPVRPSPGWPVGRGAARDAIQATVAARARDRRGGTGPRPHPRPGHPEQMSGDASAPLRRIPPVRLPEPMSARAGRGLVKRLVHRLTAWELDPLVRQINSVQSAAVVAVDRAAAPPAEPPAAEPPAADPPAAEPPAADPPAAEPPAAEPPAAEPATTRAAAPATRRRRPSRPAGRP
jgi:glycosyltransferase involved in cell wall biosynthesis